MIYRILVDSNYIEYGLVNTLDWDYNKAPHMVIFGATGSGKTYFSRILLSKIAIQEMTAQLYICDFKGDDDFAFLDRYKRAYRFMDCANGLQEVSERLKRRQSGQECSRDMIVLFFDEWASYCNSLDKKTLEEEKKKLSNLLMLGRSFNIHVIVSQQRADAIYFNSARDNFNVVIGLGNLSEESKNMLFHDFKDKILANKQQGTGYMAINGCDFKAITVPGVENIDQLNNLIVDGVVR